MGGERKEREGEGEKGERGGGRERRERGREREHEQRSRDEGRVWHTYSTYPLLLLLLGVGVGVRPESCQVGFQERYLYHLLPHPSPHPHLSHSSPSHPH